MSQIGSKTDVLRTQGQSIITQNGEIQNAIAQVIASVDEATANWDGASSSTYLDNFNELKPTITTQLSECLEALGNQLISVGDAYEQMDQEISSKLSGG